jgi:hypothetical protein
MSDRPAGEPPLGGRAPASAVTVDLVVAALAATPLPPPIVHGNRTTRTLGQGLTRGQLEVLARAAHAAVAAPVLALHVPAVNDRWCAGCSRPYPCPTVRALGVEGRPG